MRETILMGIIRVGKTESREFGKKVGIVARREEGARPSTAGAGGRGRIGLGEKKGSF